MIFLKKIISKIIILFFIVIAFLMPELLARMFFTQWAPSSDSASLRVSNAQSGWLHSKSSDLVFLDAPFRSNNYGFRDFDWGEKSKPRLLFLGDSFTWGWGVKNSERFTEKLQKKIPEIEIINAGMNGYSTLQEYVVLKSLGEKLKPDIVILQLYDNDFSDNIDSGKVYYRPYFDFENDFYLANNAKDKSAVFERIFKYVINETYFYRQVFAKIYIFMAKKNWLKKTKWANPSEDDLHEAMKLSLQRINQYCVDKDIKFILFYHDLSADKVRFLKVFSENEGVVIHALDEAFLQAKEPYRLHANSHWNAYGHDLVSQFIFSKLGKKQ